MLASFESRRFDSWISINSEMKTLLDLFADIFSEIGGEKYKEFNGVNFSSTTAWTKVLANFERQ